MNEWIHRRINNCDIHQTISDYPVVHYLPSIKWQPNMAASCWRAASRYLFIGVIITYCSQMRRRAKSEWILDYIYQVDRFANLNNWSFGFDFAPVRTSTLFRCNQNFSLLLLAPPSKYYICYTFSWQFPYILVIFLRLGIATDFSNRFDSNPQGLDLNLSGIQCVYVTLVTHVMTTRVTLQGVQSGGALWSHSGALVYTFCSVLFCWTWK